MKKVIFTSVTLISLTLSSGVRAQEDIKQQQINGMVGFGAGATSGALVGGPIGAIVGGLVGVLIADDANDEARLEVAQTKLQRQQSQLVALQAQYDKAKQESQLQLVAMDQQIERIMQEMETNIQFRTASYVLEDHFKSQLKLVAKGLKDNPELVARLSGFADSRGDSSYNQALSEQRVISVKDFLVSHGVKEKQVLTHSFGESQPVSAQENTEDYFFDRRVLLRVEQGSGAMTASNL